MNEPIFQTIRSSPSELGVAVAATVLLTGIFGSAVAFLLDASARLQHLPF